MKKSQMAAIVTLLSLILMVGIVIVVLLVRSGAGDDATSTESSVATETIASSTSEAPSVDPVSLLESTPVNSIHSAPAPDAPDEWGEYRLRRTWDGMVRVFEGAEPSPVTDDGGARFPLTMNRCGIGMFLVTFKSVNPNVDIAAQLIDSVGGVLVEEDINQGWSLSTNCETPAYRFLQSGDVSNLGDVVFTVHEYIQSSTSDSGAEAARATPREAEPTLVQCLGYLGPPMGVDSDGVERPAPECEGSPEQQRALKGERVCGGLYGWMEVSAAEYRDLCGVNPPTDRTPPPETPAPPPQPAPSEPEDHLPTE